MNIKLAAVVLLLSISVYYLGTWVILPGVGVLVVLIVSPVLNRKNYVSSVAARKARAGETSPYRKVGCKDKLFTQPPGVSTLYENFLNGVKLSGGNRPCLGTREGATFKWETYNEVQKKIENFGSGLIDLGVKPGSRVGFYAKNRSEWFIGAEACNFYSFVSVAIYDTLGEENREFVINQSGIEAICTTNNLIPNLISLAPTCKQLRIVAIMGPVKPEEREACNKVGLDVYTFEEIYSRGESNHQQPIPPKPDDLAILMYTSGTTSRPKGVMITNKNVVAVIAGVMDCIPATKEDRYLSYLPLAHILERAAEAYIISRGGSIGFFQGDLRKLTDDIKTLKPTIYAGVPKVFQRIMNEVKKQINDAGFVAKTLFSVLYALKRKFRTVGLPTGLFDKILFNKIKGGLGGEVRCIVSGGAPLAKECHEFLSICFAPTVQGYGLTETCGGATTTPMDYVEPYGRAGAPISSCEIKLVSKGSYSVNHNPPQGELCVKGDNISLGYYEMPEKTKEDFEEVDGERWFHTGDAAQLNPDGTFSIIGRVKDIFKLDGGEYIAPERLESIYAQSKFVSNIFVWGDSFKSYIVAVVIPEVTAAQRWAKEHNVSHEDCLPPNCPESLCRNEALKKAITEDLKRLAMEAKLNRYEELPYIHLDGLFWTPDTGLVTDAMKNKRDPLLARYKKEIDAIYEAHAAI